MAEILLVESNPRFLEMASASIRGLGHEPVEAGSAEEALEFLAGVIFGCVVSNHKLVEGIRKQSAVPVVALADPEEADRLPGLLELPYVSALTKPCTGYELAMAVQLTLAVQTSPRFFRVPLSSVTPSVLELDLYTMKDGVAELFRAKGTKMEAAYWNQFVATENAQIYASLDGIDRLIPGNLRLARAAAAGAGSPLASSASILVRVCDLIGERVQFMGVDEKTIEHAMHFIDSFLQASSSASLIEILEALEDRDRETFSDSLCAMAVAVMIAQRLRWNPEEIQKVAFAGLFHDVGKLQLPEKLLKTPRPLMSFGQRLSYDSHPELGKKFLLKSGLVSPEICDIVHQHHEDNNGTGIPQRLKRDQIHPIARLLRVADLFVARAVPTGARRALQLEKAIESVAKEPGIELEFFLVLKELSGTAAAAKANRKS